MTNDITTLGELTDWIKDAERAEAPGSETEHWGDYVEDMRAIVGAVPLGDYDRSIEVPRESVEFWVAQYGAQS